MTKSLIWSCEKKIHAYASKWRCLMHDMIIELLEKACVHVHHLEISTQEWKWKQLSAIMSDSRQTSVKKQQQHYWLALTLLRPMARPRSHNYAHVDMASNHKNKGSFK